VSTPGERVGRDLEIPAPPRRRVFLRIEELPDDQSPPHPGGRRVLLARPSAHAVRLAAKSDATEPGTVEHVDALYDLAEVLILAVDGKPLSREDVERVSAETIHYIYGLFNSPLGVLEQIAKNAEAPLAEAGKGSNSVTPSPTRARGSAKRSRSGR
jgi:hypothetical protein